TTAMAITGSSARRKFSPPGDKETNDDNTEAPEMGTHTHPGHILEIEWKYDPETRRDTGREHRCVSYRYPNGTYIHRDTHGADVAQEHYKKLLAEHKTKN